MGDQSGYNNLGYEGHYKLDQWMDIYMQWISSLLSVLVGLLHVLQPSGSTLGCLCRCCRAVNTWINSSHVRSPPYHSFSQRGMGFLFGGSSGCPLLGGVAWVSNEEGSQRGGRGKLRSKWPQEGDWSACACTVWIAQMKVLLVDALGQVHV